MQLLELGVTRVGDLSPHELGDPRVTHPGGVANARPVTAPRLQKGSDFGVEIDGHGRILVKVCSGFKQHFPTRQFHPLSVAVKDINQVVAEQLAHWMAQRKPVWTQAELAERAGVAQKTISNYLNPEQRAPGAKGKQGSPKLVELDLIAQALGIEVWQLTRHMNEGERAAYEAIERAYKQLLAGARPAVPAEAAEPAERPLTPDEMLEAQALEHNPVKDRPRPAAHPQVRGLSQRPKR